MFLFKVDKLPENLRKLFKQILKLYERDTNFQNGLDHIMESSQVQKLFKI
jgi:hypothetical protein